MNRSRPVATRRTLFTPALAVGITAAVTFGLLGCSSGETGTDAASQASAAASETPAPAAEPSAAPTPTDASAATKSGLPEGFPSAVPLVSDDIERSEAHGDDEWIVWLEVDDIPGSAADARAQLTDAGFAERTWHTDEKTSKGVFASTDYGVVLVAIAAPGHGEFIYKVFTE